MKLRLEYENEFDEFSDEACNDLSPQEFDWLKEYIISRVKDFD